MYYAILLRQKVGLNCRCWISHIISNRILPYYQIGRTLEETATLFDGDSVPHEIVTMAGEAATVNMVRLPEVYNAGPSKQRMEDVRGMVESDETSKISGI